MKIGLFTDPHYSTQDVACRTRRPRLSYDKIREAMEHFQRERVDLVLCLGDLTDDSGSERENIEATKDLVQMIRSFEIPFYSMMGNHDYQNFTREEFCRYTGGAYPPFSLCYDNTILVFLDCNYREGGEIYEKGRVNWVDTALPIDQYEALRTLLSENVGRTVYVFSHQNLDGSVEKRHIVQNAAEIRALLARAGSVRAVIQGHYHPGKDSDIDGIPYRTLPAMCEGERNYFEILEIL